jgi:hypothetical protein
MRRLATHQAHNLEIAGSSPASATPAVFGELTGTCSPGGAVRFRESAQRSADDQRVVGRASR